MKLQDESKDQVLKNSRLKLPKTYIFGWFLKMLSQRMEVQLQG